MQAELKKRILSAAILAPVVLGIVYVGGWAFSALMLLCFIIMYKEWLTITKPSPKRWWWAAWGLIYVGWPSFTLGFAGSNHHLQNYIYLVIIIVWSTDIGAYFVGRKFGKHKIAPSISPKKSWEGLAGGMLFSLIAVSFFYFKELSNIVSYYNSYPFSVRHVLLALVFLPIISQVGDFYESWIKRKFGVKDSGTIIPGHGGLLDRMDGILSVTWVVSIYILIKFYLEFHNHRPIDF